MRVFLSTADASGDLHGAALVAELRARLAQRGEALELFGLGGRELQSQGLEPIARQSDLAIGGLVEVLEAVPRVLRAYADLRRELRSRAPDLVVLIDSPDLNLPLAAVARRSRRPVFYYIAPQVWAWRLGRLRKMRARVDHVGVIFPFEAALFRDAGVAATFVGHPLVERIATLRRELKPESLARELGLDLGRPILGLLPGSRSNELAGNLEVMLATARLLRSAQPELQVCLLVAPTLAERPLAAPADVTVVRGRSQEAMALATALLAAPGTVTVEAALLGVPMLVTHRVNRLSFEIARRVTRVPSSCMVNLIADSGVVSERLQQQARPAALAAELSRLLRDPEARERQRDLLAAATRRLGRAGASERAAGLALEVAGRS